MSCKELTVGEITFNVEEDRVYVKNLRDDLIIDKNCFMVICPKCLESTGYTLEIDSKPFRRMVAKITCKKCNHKQVFKK